MPSSDSGSTTRTAATPRPESSAAPSLESLTRLIETDPFSLPADRRVELLTIWERHSAWLDCLKADVLAAVAGPGEEHASGPHDDSSTDQPPTDPRELFAVEDSICDEVAVALRVATTTARNRVQVARDLQYKLPHTRRLLREGNCSYAQAAVVSDECELLTAPQAHQVESTALDRVPRQTPAQTRRSVRRAVASICPPDPIEEIEAEFARRDVTFFADGPIMATITATVPAPDAIAIWNALTGCAARDKHEGDTRTMAHKRADALISWANNALDDPQMPTFQGKKRLETQIVISWETLIGMNDDAADVIGYGPIPAHYARRLASESASWRRLITDGVTGHLLDYGTKTYQPPSLLREYVIARDRTCQFPGCNVAGWRCDIDHVEPWTGDANGGSTSAENLITLCRRHHRLKTHNHWRVRRDEPDRDDPESRRESATRWTSPRGQELEPPSIRYAATYHGATHLERTLATRLVA